MTCIAAHGVHLASYKTLTRRRLLLLSSSTTTATTTLPLQPTFNNSNQQCLTLVSYSAGGGLGLVAGLPTLLLPPAWALD